MSEFEYQGPKIKQVIYGLILITLLYMTAFFFAPGNTITYLWLARVKAELGNAEAQNHLGFLYFTGNGVTKDPAEGVKWWQKSAEQGLVKSKFNLALAYDRGEGIPRNTTEAIKLYQEPAEHGDSDAQYNLGRLYEENGSRQNYDEAFKWYRKAANAGHIQAIQAMGYAYANGKGVPPDDEEAQRWYLKGAALNDSESEAALGYNYLNGKGVAKDPAEAERWYNKAAEHGNAKAQYDLGYMYYYGSGLNKDQAAAIRWWNKAAEKGNDQAKKALLYVESTQGISLWKRMGEQEKSEWLKDKIHKQQQLLHTPAPRALTLNDGEIDDTARKAQACVESETAAPDLQDDEFPLHIISRLHRKIYLPASIPQNKT
jgi:TPR repeat protein